MKKLLLGEDGDINLDLKLGETVMQEAYIVLTLRRGALKSDPALGPDLNKFINGRVNTSAVEREIKIHMQKAGVDWSTVKDRLDYVTTTV